MPTDQRPASLLTRIIAACALRLAQHPAVPPENREAFEAAARSVMHQLWSEYIGGESVWLRLYAPRTSPLEREQRDARIRAAIAADLSPEVIASKERMSVRHVYRIKAALTSQRVDLSADPPR